MSLDSISNLTKHEVRLFPSLHISSHKEAEQRATASLLAIIRAVSEFGRAFVQMAGGPKGTLGCYTEVSFEMEGPGKKETARPDGIVRVVRGKTEWKAFVEVKVGNNALEQEQCDLYHSLAKSEGFDALITISNQTALPNSLPPIQIDRRRLRSVPVIHFSWERLLSEARILSLKSLVKDSDQAWMLDEWIKYVAEPASKIIELPDLGEHWNSILKSARDGTLRASSRKLEDVVRHWDGFLRKAAFRLRSKLGVDVEPRMSRAEKIDADVRIKHMRNVALRDGRIQGAFKIPHTAGDLSLELDLRTKAVRYRVDLNPPTSGRGSTRVNWLLRQLRGPARCPQRFDCQRNMGPKRNGFPFHHSRVRRRQRPADAR